MILLTDKVLKEYEKVQPGSADRLLKLAKNERRMREQKQEGIRANAKLQKTYDILIIALAIITVTIAALTLR